MDSEKFALTLSVVACVAAMAGLVKPYINGSKRWHFAAALVFSLWWNSLFFGGRQAAPLGLSNEPYASRAGLEFGDGQQASAPAFHEWSYSTRKDTMRGTEDYFAERKATSDVFLDPPYGQQRPVLVLRRSAKYGIDVMFGVPEGQILCHSYENTRISLKFDDEPVRTYGCSEGSDGSNNMIFLRGAQGFIVKLRTSKKVMIELPFYRNGMQQITFETANLKWP